MTDTPAIAGANVIRLYIVDMIDLANNTANITGPPV
jgi:hypothetical protein